MNKKNLAMDEWTKQYEKDDFYRACITGDIEALNNLFEIHSGRDFDKETGLFLGAFFGHVEVVNFLTHIERRYFIRAAITQSIKRIFKEIEKDHYPVNSNGFRALMEKETSNQLNFKVRILNKEIESGNYKAIKYTLECLKPFIPAQETSYVYRAIFKGKSPQIVKLLLEYSFPLDAEMIEKVFLFSYFDLEGYMKSIAEMFLVYIETPVYSPLPYPLVLRDVRLKVNEINQSRILYKLANEDENVDANLRRFIGHVYRRTIRSIISTVIVYLQLIAKHPLLLDVLMPHVISDVHIRAMTHLQKHHRAILKERNLLDILQGLKLRYLSLHCKQS